MKSAKNVDELNKTKNNISSGKYRKRKALERKELDNKIANLETKNRRLNEKILKNQIWFENVKLLFPDITLPWWIFFHFNNWWKKLPDCEMLGTTAV